MRLTSYRLSCANCHGVRCFTSHCRLHGYMVTWSSYSSPQITTCPYFALRCRRKRLSGSKISSLWKMRIIPIWSPSFPSACPSSLSPKSTSQVICPLHPYTSLSFSHRTPVFFLFRQFLLRCSMISLPRYSFHLLYFPSFSPIFQIIHLTNPFHWSCAAVLTF